MLTFLSKTWLYLVLIAVIIVLTIGLISIERNNQKLRAQLQEKTEKVTRLTKLKSVVEPYLHNNKEYNAEASKNVYKKWMASKELAEQFYKESDGRFKKQWGLFLAIQARKHKINPEIVFELLKVETGGTFDPELVGPKTEYGRAYGMAQFMTNTAPWIAKMAGLAYKKEKLFDPYYSIELSITYLDFLYERYGNWNKALTAYNRGMGGLASYIEKHGDSKSTYAVTIRERTKIKNVDFAFGG